MLRNLCKCLVVILVLWHVVSVNYKIIACIERLDQGLRSYILGVELNV